MKIKVIKSERRLIVYDGGSAVFSCNICLGRCPVGPKEHEGDNRTPEGSYRICSKNPKSRFRLSMGISYPSSKDAIKAYERGEINEDILKSIEEAERGNIRPPWNTPLGGWIMLHGEHPEGKKGDWTAGCIAVSNNDIEKLFGMINIGDHIEIEA